MLFINLSINRFANLFFFFLIHNFLQTKMFESMIENTYKNTSFQDIALNDSDLDQMINDANAFISVTSSNEFSFVMILMNLSIMFYQENVLINFSFCDVTKFDVFSFNVAESVTSYSCENSENVSSWNNSVETQKNVFSSHEEQSSAKIFNNIALFNVTFMREISSSSNIIFT